MIITTGKVLKKYREKAGISQKGLSGATGVPRGTISACELRNTKINRKTAKIYDDFFDVKKSLIRRFLDWF